MLRQPSSSLHFSLQRRRLSPQTIRAYDGDTAALRGFCRWLLSRRLLAADPWAGTTVAAGRARKLPRVLPAHELDRPFGFLRSSAAIAGATVPDAGGLARPHDATTPLAVASPDARVLL